MDPEVKDALRSYLSSRKDIAFSLLFGSALTGRRTVESDVDIAVYFYDPAPPGEGPPSSGPPGQDDGEASAPPDEVQPLEIEEDLTFPQEDEVWAALDRIVQSEVDLVVLNRAPATVGSAAAEEGELLSLRDQDLFTRYRLAAFRLAVEFREFQRDFIAIRRRSRSLSPRDEARLERIAEYVRDELEDASLYREATHHRYREDAHFRLGLERWIENLVNASIDIAKIVVASQRLPATQTYRESLQSLQSVEEFSTLAEPLSRNTKIRNALAHEYLDIRYREVARVAAEAEELYGRLAAATDNYLRHKRGE